MRVYIDDLSIITRGTLDDQLLNMENVLTKLRNAGIKVNTAKSLFCTHEIEYLGYILTREGIEPRPKKVHAILTLNLPYNAKELRHFLGMIQYCQDMWAKHSEMLAPLTNLAGVGECGKTKSTKKNKTKKKPWRWDPTHQQVFDNVKAAIKKKLSWPIQSFKIYTHASTMQLGVVLIQDNRPIVFFSRKLSKAQQKHSVTKIELLAIVETLKDFNRMLWGQTIKVFTNHMNLTRDALGLTSNRVYQWRLNMPTK